MIAFQLTIDCVDRHRLARFWADALGYRPQGFTSWRDFWLSRGKSDEDAEQLSQSFDTIVDPAGHGPQIWFQEVPERKSIKNRLHLDIDASGRIGGSELPADERVRKIRATVERLTVLGASTAEHQPDQDWFVIMHDPKATSSALPDTRAGTHHRCLEGPGVGQAGRVTRNATPHSLPIMR